MQVFKRNEYIKGLYRAYKGTNVIALDYKIDCKPRWNDTVGHPELSGLISSRLDQYEKSLSGLLDLKPLVHEINSGVFQVNPSWTNGFIPAFDALTIMWAARHSKNTYMEVGSGNSTKFARASIAHGRGDTKLVSIDPSPRAEIDTICDEVIRQPLEKIDLSIFDDLAMGDTLFIDNSHRSFMNSDVTTIMLDVLPRLKSGVRVGFHDIFLPFDYFETWAGRFYNEQYLLACYLLSQPNYFVLEMPSYWLHKMKVHQRVLADMWVGFDKEVRDRAPSSFWVIKN